MAYSFRPELYTVSFEQHWTSIGMSVVQMVSLAIRLEFLQDFIFLFLESFRDVYDRPERIFPLVSGVMNGLSLLLDSSFLLLIFTDSMSIVHNLFEFFKFV